MAAIVGLLAAVPVAGQAEAGEPDAGPGGEGRIELRAARPPAASERARMRRWHRAWREETRPLEALLGPLGAAEQPARVGNPRWCRALAESLIALDRERALAGPCRAADLHLRRGIDRLVLGAAACLEGRLYAAAHRVREAHAAFAEAGEVLRPYGVQP